MLAVDLDFQLILLLLAGAVWVIGKAAERIRHIRDATAGEMRKRSEQRQVEWTSSDEDHDSVLRERIEEALEMPVPAPRPPLRPPGRRPPLVAPPPARRPPRAAPGVQRRRVRRPLVQGLRGNSRRLKEAIVLREVLGPPVALRGRRR